MYEEDQTRDEFRIRAEIDLDAIYENVCESKKNIEKANPDKQVNIIAVVKADGYGHGAVETAKKVDPLVGGYGVATIGEAVELREAGIGKMILILGHVLDCDLKKAVDYDISQAIFDYETAKKLSNIAINSGKRAKIQIKLDCSMGRIGFRMVPESIAEILNIIALPGLETEGIFTHFANADEADKTRVTREYIAFSEFVNDLRMKGLPDTAIVHCANSAAIIDTPYMSENFMRLGISLYGLYPSDDVNHNEVKLKPAMSVRSCISYVKTVPAGTRISYNGTYETKRETVVATIPAGYADGYPRLLSNKGNVIIKGRRAPIIGRVCMDQFMVDVTDIAGVQRGDVATLLGRDGQEEITADELAKLCDTINYEIVCGISKRVPRVYRGI